LGFRKFRITGGEPLVRKGVVEFIAEMSKIDGVSSIGMTTNGTRLSPIAKELKKAGLNTINISLDALTPNVYRSITHGEIEPVLDGIQAALGASFDRIKLNMVLIRKMNEEEIWPLIHFSAEHHILLRFIELMPVSLTEVLNEENFLSVGEVMQRIRERDTLIPLIDTKFGHGPARYYQLENIGVSLGFIGAITNLHFCDSCNKIRLTADGKIRPCLGNHNEVDIRTALRSGSSDADLGLILENSISEKPPEHLFRQNYQPQRVMTAIGG
jgi:cyclic pyranopterin phosphate synthase